MTVLAGLLFLPHALWMAENDWITLRYITERSDGGLTGWWLHLVYPLGFLASQLGAVLPILFLAWPLVRGRPLRRRSGAEAETMDYLRWMVLIPLLIYLIVSMIHGLHLRSMWGGPLFSFAGVLWLASFELSTDQLNIRRFIRGCLIVGIVMAVGLTARNCLGPAVRHKASRVHFPGPALSQQVQDRWRARFGTDLPAVGGTFDISANIGIQCDFPVMVYADMDPEVSPWMDDEDFQASGGVIVWNARQHGTELPLDFQQRFDHVEIGRPIICNYQTLSEIEPAEFGIALVAPTPRLTRAPDNSRIR